MKKQSAERVSVSIPTWADLESCLQMKMRGWLQDLLDTRSGSAPPIQAWVNAREKWSSPTRT